MFNRERLRLNERTVHVAIVQPSTCFLDPRMAFPFEIVVLGLPMCPSVWWRSMSSREAS